MAAKKRRRKNAYDVERGMTGFAVRIRRKGYGPYTITEGGAMTEARAKRVAQAHANQGYRADVLRGGSVVDVYAPTRAKTNPAKRKNAKNARRRAKKLAKRPAKRNATAIERAKKRSARERTEAYAAGVAAALRKMGYRVKVERGERR